MPGDDGTRRGGPDAWRRCCLPDLDPWPHRRGGIAEVLTPLRSWVAGVRRHLSDRFLRASLTRNVRRRTDFCQRLGVASCPRRVSGAGFLAPHSNSPHAWKAWRSRIVSRQTLGLRGRRAAARWGGAPSGAAIRASRPICLMPANVTRQKDDGRCPKPRTRRDTRHRLREQRRCGAAKEPAARCASRRRL